MAENLIAQEFARDYPQTVQLVEVKVRDRGEVKKMGAGAVALEVGDRVMLDLDGELTYGVVYGKPYPTPFAPPMRVMTSVLRKATPDEAAAIRRHEHVTREALAVCRQQTSALGLKMKLVEAYCSFQRRQMTFVYSADDRIDFRELVRALVRRFGGRIEMRQISVREEASRLGGIDTCGLVLCCASFLSEVRPVSVKQARALGLPVEDPRLLGVCGRLKCCLLFEAMDAQSPVSRGQGLITPSRPTERSTSLS